MSRTRHPVLWVHGKESGPMGTKFHALVDGQLAVHAPDLRGMDLSERLEALVPLVERLRPVIVGSSLGGISALLAAIWVNVRLPGIVLCAPALAYEWANDVPIERMAPPKGTPVSIIHGSNDVVIPLELSRRYVSVHTCCELTVVPDDHRLSQSSKIIVDRASRFA